MPETVVTVEFYRREHLTYKFDGVLETEAIEAKLHDLFTTGEWDREHYESNVIEDDYSVIDAKWVG